jgi:hypothetical protein
MADQTLYVIHLNDRPFTIHTDLETAKLAYARLVTTCSKDSRRQDDRVCLKIYQEKVTHNVEERLNAVRQRNN